MQGQGKNENECRPDEASAVPPRRIHLLQATCNDCAEILHSLLREPEMRAGPNGEGQDAIDIIEAVANDLIDAAKS